MGSISLAYDQLNKVTINSVMDQLIGACVFSKIDLQSVLKDKQLYAKMSKCDFKGNKNHIRREGSIV
ncbi:hypothetical protein CR513_12878, partial [Mucuna pruriens]